MRILIIGEYSGFAYNLAIGFEELGHEVIEFGSLDGIKNIPQTSKSFLYNNQNYTIGSLFWRIREISNFLRYKKDIKKFHHYFDVVFIINYTFLRLEFDFSHPRFSINDIKHVIKPHGKVFMSSCGADLPVMEFAKKLRYTPYSSEYMKSCYGWRFKQVLKRTLKLIDGVIPTMYEYAEAYRQFSENNSIVKVLSTIPLPLDCHRYKFEKTFNEKVVVFHGKARLTKGGNYIIPALERLKKMYPNKVDIVIQGNLPFAEYIKILSKADIVVDQCRGYSYGMNAIIAMAMGKIVLSGNEPECEREFNMEVPIINILPDSDDIFNKLEELINGSEDFLRELSRKSYDFCNYFHDSKIIAKKYIECFKS